MTFDELLTEVYTLTSRPDLIAETKTAVKAATLKAHQTDFYSKDIYEKYVELSTEEDYVFSFDYISYIPNFRAIKYIRRLDTNTNEPSAFLTVVDPTDVLDMFGSTKTDVCYIAGRIIEIKSSVAFSKMILGCYVLPIVSETNFASWVAELYPYSIVFEAARVVFKTIGYDEQSAQYEKLVAEQYTLLRSSAFSDEGY